MKLLIYGIIVSMLITSCSKKSAEQPAPPHIIKFTVSGSDAFNASVSAHKTTDSSPNVLDTKVIAQGVSYTYTTTLQQNDQAILSVSSDAANTISYKIYDNDKIVVQDAGKEILTHGSFTVSYDVP